MATPQQIARLAAGAKGGTAGVAEFDQAAKQVGASRDQAIGQMTHQASALMAPGALTAQLAGNLRTSAQGAISDLGEYSGAAANADAQDQAGTANYINEANAAIPLINAYSNNDLQQKIAMLAAQRARSTARAGGTAKPLSDAQLRTDLLGLAELNRQNAGAQQQQQYKADLAHLDAVAKGGPGGPNALAPDQILNTAPAIGAFGPQGAQGPPGTVYPNAPAQPGHGFLTALPSNVLHQQPVQTGTPAPPKLVNGPATIANNFSGELDQQALARQSAVQKILNDLHGPGITQEAIAQGEKAGIDPNRLYGLLTPQVDAQYVRAQEAEGLYKDPNRVTSTDQVLPPEVAAKAIGMDAKTFQGAFASSYFDWNGDNNLKTGFAKWQAVNPGEQQKDPAVQQADFEADPNNSHFAKNVVEDVLHQAPTLIRQGWSFPLFAAEWRRDPGYASNRQAVELALKMVEPIFDAATAKRTRVSSVSVGQAVQGG